MVTSLVTGLPGWVVAGVGLGVVLAVLVIAAFAIGTRRFPDPLGPAAAVSDGGEARRRAEIRAYLRTIEEPFIEDHQLEGRTVAFYLPDHAVAVTFDAKDYFVLERAGVRTVLVEYELPGSSLGGRLPFETPDADTAPNPVEQAFARLGLSPAANEAAVRAAYRERVKDAHPDHGGDRETFHRLREAYTMALDRTD